VPPALVEVTEKMGTTVKLEQSSARVELSQGAPEVLGPRAALAKLVLAAATAERDRAVGSTLSAVRSP
jgi:hypothetical protein